MDEIEKLHAENDELRKAISLLQLVIKREQLKTPVPVDDDPWISQTEYLALFYNNQRYEIPTNLESRLYKLIYDYVREQHWDTPDINSNTEELLNVIADVMDVLAEDDDGDDDLDESAAEFLGKLEEVIGKVENSTSEYPYGYTDPPSEIHPDDMPEWKEMQRTKKKP